MLKKSSILSIFKQLCEVVYRNKVIITSKKGRPCEIPKYKIISFILLWKTNGEGLEKMELDSEVFLNRHYDHSNFGYHYKKLSSEIIYNITSVYEKLCNGLLKNKIIFHIYDSTAISTSVREERLRQGTRNKEKITKKFHTALGYDPPNKLVLVEAMLASNHHISDANGALIMNKNKNWVGYDLGDSAYETYDLINETINQKRVPVFKPTKKPVRKKTSYKEKLRKKWNGNLKRIYKEIRGIGEVLYGAATRAGLMMSNSRLTENQYKDALVIGLRQNMLTYLRLKALVRIIRKTPYFLFSL